MKTQTAVPISNLVDTNRVEVVGRASTVRARVEQRLNIQGGKKEIHVFRLIHKYTAKIREDKPVSCVYTEVAK